MGFWDAFNASKHSYFQYVNSRRGERPTFTSIDSTLTGLEGWKREFRSLRQDAEKERNRTAAEAKVEEILGGIQTKTDQLLDLRRKLQQRKQGLDEQITRLEDSKNRLESSILHDNTRFLALSGKRGNAWQDLSRKINEKKRKVQEMEQSLSRLRGQLTSLY